MPSVGESAAGSAATGDLALHMHLSPRIITWIMQGGSSTRVLFCGGAAIDLK